MAGKRQKAADQLQFTRGGRGRAVTTLAAPEPATVRVPPLPKGMGATARKRWRAFWHSPIAALVNLESDGEALYRWIACIDDRERYTVRAREQPLTTGSTGQQTRNPLFGVIADLTREIERFEEQFGGTPLARMRLGLAFGEAATSLGDLQRSLLGGGSAARASAATATEDDDDGLDEFIEAEFVEVAPKD
jgi:P27 family predicted phage terminase small subunit